LGKILMETGIFRLKSGASGMILAENGDFA
jgi:hypothetical protein